MKDPEMMETCDIMRDISQNRKSKMIVTESLGFIRGTCKDPLATSVMLVSFAWTIALRESIRYYMRHPLKAIFGK
jgi:hypothetical protein